MSITTLAPTRLAVNRGIKFSLRSRLPSSLLVQSLARSADLLPSFLFYLFGRLVLSATEIGDFFLQLLIAREPTGVERAVLQRLLDRAVGFRPVLALANGTLPRQLGDILEDVLDALVSTPEL